MAALTSTVNDTAGVTDPGAAFDYADTYTDKAGGTDVFGTVSVRLPVPVAVVMDWNGNGLFGDIGDDVTNRVRGGISVTYGRDQSSPSSPVVAGSGSYVLDNTSRDYSPRNTSSPLYGKVRPARAVLITRNVFNTSYTIFRGHTDDTPLSPDLNSRTVGFSLIDYLADFRGITVTTQLYSGLRTGAAIGIVLDAAGWTGPRDLDIGGTLIPWFWADGEDALDTLKDLVASEGPPALLTVDTNGGIVFRDRHHRYRSSASKTVQATFHGSEGAGEPILNDLVYQEPWSNIVNTLTFDVDERGGANFGSVWSTSDSFIFTAGQSQTFVVKASDPFMSAVAPVAGIDYIIVSGSITSANLSRTSGQSTSITMTAGASGAQINGLQLRAQSVPVLRTYTVSASDSTSIGTYGARSSVPGSPVWASRADVESLAKLWVATRKDPLPQVQAKFSVHATQATRMTAVLQRDLSDRVAVVESQTGLNGDNFFIDSISHEIPNITEHAVTFGMEAVPAGIPTSAFTVGTSTLGGTTPLAY